MDATTFDDMTRSAGRSLSRRGFGRLAGVGAVAAALLPALKEAPAAEAKRRRAHAEHNLRGKKAIMCFENSTIRVPKKKRKSWLKRGATRGACSGCVPTCPAGSCGNDGCGGTCACAAGSVCAEGMCQTCTVTCSGTPAECGAALAQRLIPGGAVYVCPGVYAGPFTVTTATQIYGPGSGSDPSRSAILDGQGASSTVTVGVEIPAVFTGLRIINGAASQFGGGIFGNFGSRLTVTACVIDANTASDGGGVFFFGVLEMTDTQVTNNTAFPGGGGGISGSSGLPDTSMLRNCLISGNSGAVGGSGSGGGVTLVDVNMDIIGTEISNNTGRATGGLDVNVFNVLPVVTVDAGSKVTGNTALAPISAGGINGGGGTVTVSGATVSGNTNPQCFGTVTGC